MKLTNRTKKKWFYENVNSYEILCDSVIDPRLVKYTFDGMFYKAYRSLFHSSEAESFIRYIRDMKDWEIFFKFRKFLRYDLNKSGFKMNYRRYNKQLFD